MSDVPKTHSCYLSLILRDTIVEGVEQGITSIHGLIAGGRVEAMEVPTRKDYSNEAVLQKALQHISRNGNG